MTADAPHRRDLRAARCRDRSGRQSSSPATKSLDHSQPRPAWKVVRAGPPRRAGGGQALDRRGLRADPHRRRARARCSAARASRRTARSRRPSPARCPSILAGGLRPANVAQSVRDVPAIGVDVASGVEIAGTKPPRKDPLAVALFVKRARAARFDRPTSPRPTQPRRRPCSKPTNAAAGEQMRDFGGRYVPETLMSALLELEHTYFALRDDPTFWAELRELGSHFAGRPTPIYRADRLARSAGPRCSAVSQARGPGTYRRAQDQQRPRPGPACQAAGQDAA